MRILKSEDFSTATEKIPRDFKNEEQLTYDEKKMLQSHLIYSVDLRNERKQKTLTAIFSQCFRS